MNKKQMIVDAVRDTVRYSEEAYYERKQAHAVCEAKRAIWNSFNKDDGVGSMSMNPYHPESMEDGIEAARVKLERCQEAHAYAIETFLGGI